MSSNYDVFVDDSIENYINLYNEGKNINRDIEPLQNENYRVLSLANTDIRVLDRDEVYEKLVRLDKIKFFLNDHVVRNTVTGKDTFVAGNRYFYMIPVQTVKGTIVDFIFRRTFDSQLNGFDFKKNRYHSVKPIKEDTIKRVPFMYGFYKDFENFDYDSRNGSKPIVVCEGSKDCIYLKQFYPYVLSINTSTIGFNAYILRNLTNKIVFVSDSDETGTKEFYKDRYILKNLGFRVLKVKLDKGIKDPASYINYPELEETFKKRFLKTIDKSEII